MRCRDAALDVVDWRQVAEAAVRPDGVVQGDEITPTRSRNSRFFIGGIRGSGMLFMSMRCWSSAPAASFAAVRMVCHPRELAVD